MISKKLRRSLLVAGGTALLAAPACAAVCPKGHSACTYPGRCFLYTDADGNSLCDYTSGDSGTSVSETDQITISGNSTDTSAATQTDTGSDTVSSVISTSSSTSSETVSSGDSGLSPLVFSAAGLIIGGAVILLLAIAMKYLRKEKPEVLQKIFVYAGISPILLGLLIVLYDPELFGIRGTLADMISSYSGIVYMFGGTLLAAVLWLKNAMSKEALISISILTSAAGFLLIIPIAPDGFSSTISGIIALSFAGLGFAGLVALLVITYFFGRVFCAHMCPAGVLQELLYRIPVKKVQIKDRRIPKTIRAGFFAALVIGVFCSIDIFEYIGISSFFALMFTAAAGVFLVILLASVFIYRPFCTFLCPYGCIFSIISRFGRFGLKRTDKCINCRKCEKICPTGEAGSEAKKAECYLCGKCIEKCPVDSAIIYGKR